MKVVQINATCGVGSTGKICVAISKLLTNRGIENYILYSSNSSGYELGIQCCNKPYIVFEAIKSHIWGNYGFNSNRATKKMISELERIQPDIVHLHNIHGHDCNLEILFNYFRSKPEIKLFWTFHDCWAFTGYCPHYLMVKCYNWKNQCRECPQHKTYSLFLDRSAEIFSKKKSLFSDLNLTIITPSHWLARETKQSFLGECDVRVIHNGIDLDVFKPRNSDFRMKNGLENKKIILGVAFDWGMRKGLDVFIDLAKHLDESYQIVLVGTNEKIEKTLPNSIVTIRRTQNQKELAEIYSAADVFFNPTREDNYPTVNMESIACGTPVITFDVGGSAEMVDQYCGIHLQEERIESVIQAIEVILKNESKYRLGCKEKRNEFEEKRCFENYVGLYL